MGEYGENPDPEEEKEERELADAIFLKMETKNGGKLEIILKKRKRVVPDETYGDFYNEAIEFQQEENSFNGERKLIIKYFPEMKYIFKMNLTKVSELFSKLVDYSAKRIEQ